LTVVTHNTQDFAHIPGVTLEDWLTPSQMNDVLSYCRDDLLIQHVPGQTAPGEGLRRAFGAWTDASEELDRYLEWNRQQRKVGRPEIEQ
jgi:hypothetical protein